MRTPVKAKDIFTFRTVRKLYENLFTQGKTDTVMQNEQGILKGEFPLFPSQKYLFYNMSINKTFFDYYNSYVSAHIVEINRFDEEVLRQSLSKLIEQHDAFRIRYKKNTDNDYIQYYSETIPEIEIDKLDISGFNKHDKEVKINSATAEWRKKITVLTGKLFSFGCITGFADRSAQIHLLSHHLNTDGISWRTVGDDLKTIYDHLLNRKTQMREIPAADILGPKGTSCRQWIAALANYKEKTEKERAYWEDILAAVQKSNEKIASLTRNETKICQIKLTTALTRRILKACHQGLETRIDDILLSALNLSLYKLTGMENNCILMETHGRQDLAEDIDVSRTMGWFSSPYPIKLPPIDANTGTLIDRVKETLRKVPNEGIGFSALWLNENKVLLPEIYFNYQGEFEDGTVNSMTDDELNEMNPLSSFDISITGRVIKERLELIVVSRLSGEKASTFPGDLKNALETIGSAFNTDSDQDDE
jgi:hypothetical protein